MPVRLRPAMVVLLLANALDLSTSLFPSFVDTVQPTAPRGRWEWAVQLLLLLPLLPWLARRALRLPDLLRLPIPRLALAPIAAFVVAQAAHVGLHAENYPFSAVLMFSNAVAPKPALWRELPAAIVDRSGHAEHLSFLREGNPIFARYLKHVDYKTGWLLYMYARELPRAFQPVADQFARQGLPRPRLGTVMYRVSDGYLLLSPADQPNLHGVALLPEGSGRR